jgi:hypothetical protein
LGRRRRKLIRAAAAAGLALGLAAWCWHLFRDDPKLIVILGVHLAVIAMFARLVYLEDQHRKRCALRLVRAGDPDREQHLQFLRGYLREAGHGQTRDHLARLYNQIRVYVRDGTAEPIDLPDLPGGLRGLAPLRRRGVSGRVFVVVPRDADPYWLACNRPIEAMKYCRRVHADGFGIALWSKPVPRGVRLVDLIG